MLILDILIAMVYDNYERLTKKSAKDKVSPMNAVNFRLAWY